MNSLTMVKFFCWASAACATGSLLGAITSDQILTWAMACIAISSAILGCVIASYHKWREGMREDDRKDRLAQLEDVRAMARVQVEIEMRMSAIERRLGIAEH